MNTNERIQKLIAANPKMLAKIDAVLNGTDGRTNRQNDDCRLITYTETAKRLNVSRPTVYRLAKAGRLEIVPLDGVNRIRLQSVFNFATGTTK